MRRLFLLLVLAVLAGSCEGDAAPSTPAAPVSTVGSSTSSPTVAPSSSSAASALPEWPGVELLVTNDDGVFQIDASGEITQLVKGRVAYAVDDARGGLLFQMQVGRSLDESVDTRVWWVRERSDRAQELLVPTPGMPHDLTLSGAFESGSGNLVVIYIRHDSTWDPEVGPFTFVDSLRTYTAETGLVVDLLSWSGYEAGLGLASGFEDVVAVTLFDQVGSSCAFIDPSDGATVSIPGFPSPNPAPITPIGDPSCEADCPKGCAVDEELSWVVYSRDTSTGGLVTAIDTAHPDEIQEFEFDGMVGLLDVTDSYLLVNQRVPEMVTSARSAATLIDLKTGEQARLPVAGVAQFLTAAVNIAAPINTPTTEPSPTTTAQPEPITTSPPPMTTTTSLPESLTLVSALHLKWQVESFEQRQNPIEPQPILADCNFDDLGIEMGEVYEATIAYQYPLVPADEDETWFFGGEYTVSVQTGDVVVNARSGGFAGLPTRLTHSFHALKSDVYGDSVSVQVPKLDLFNPLSAPSFSVVLHDPSGEVIQIGEALGFDAAHWTSSSVKAVWVPWDGSICQVRGSLVYGPAGD